MKKNKQYYNDFFRKYPLDVHDNKVRFEMVSNLLYGKVLDVACGTGTLSKYYKGEYVGTDISDVAIRKAKLNRRKDARFLIYDFTKPVIMNNIQFDSVYIGEFLEHIDDDDEVFRNILSVIKPDGKIVVSVPNGIRVPDESHCRYFTVPQIRKEYSRYGKIKFYNWTGAYRRILFSIEPGKKQDNDISLVMIVKNEQKGIEKAILSALPIVDHIVISVDTKSEDKTEEIARLYADELKFHEWHDDFSEARNYAQENVKTKWILFLDGHEYIDSFGDLLEKIKFDVEGIFVTIKMESGMTFLFPRVYRSYIKFKNKVHNLNICNTRRVAPNFVIVHDRDNLQDEKSAKIREEQRDKMLPEELKKQLKENPKNPRCHFHLANFYMMRKDYKLAKKHYKKAIKYKGSIDQTYICYIYLGTINFFLGNKFRALWCYDSANKLIPNRWESARVLGGFYYMEGNYKKAAEILVYALSDNIRRYVYQPMKQNKVEIWDMIGNCFAKSNNFSKAVFAWENAIELTTEERQKKFFLQKIRLLKMLRKSGDKF